MARIDEKWRRLCYVRGPHKTATYQFTGPDGKMYRKRTSRTTAETVYAQFIRHPQAGWCFIGLEALVRYKKPDILHVKATRIES